MPLTKRWSTESTGDQPAAQIGVYELGWMGDIVYIGSGVIADRLAAHRRDTEKTWHQYRYVLTNCRRRARQIERREHRKVARRTGSLPVYNDRIG
jgi:hypothetical protein